MARAEVREGTGVLHAPGAVGVVVRVPEEGEGPYLVRFPGAHPIALRREEFVLLGPSKDEESGLRPESANAVDLRSFVIYECHVGSRAYGLDTEASDTDVRGVYLAPASMQWSLVGAPEQVEDARLQECFWELQKFLVLALKANPNVLECLWTPLVVRADATAQELLGMRDAFLSRLVHRTYGGYALAQFQKLEAARARGQERPKQAMHLLRLLISGAVVLREARVPLRLDAYRDRLLAVREGRMSWAEVDAWRVELHGDLDRAAAESRLPDRPDFERANDLLIRARRRRAAEADRS